jgi:hypothetical protein
MLGDIEGPELRERFVARIFADKDGFIFHLYPSALIRG